MHDSIQSRSSTEFERQELTPNLPNLREMHHIGALARKSYGLNNEGEETMDPRKELLMPPTVAYIGRIGFGNGKINAEHVSEDDFITLLNYAKSDCLKFVADLRELHGGCMDGRDDAKTEAGNDVKPRPKLIGGPSLFAWYVASIGQFSIIDGIEKPIDQFAVVNKRLMSRGIYLGMHHECAAAREILPITETYYNHYEDIQPLVGRQARLMTELKHGARYEREIKDGIGRTHDAAERAGSAFSEPKMLEIVRTIAGPEAVVHLEVDHDHPTKGHDEDGIVFMRTKNAIINKAKLNAKTGQKLFYNNSLYAEMIVAALATTPNELAKGVIISDELPTSGVATLGRGQHVGELSGHFLAVA